MKDKNLMYQIAQSIGQYQEATNKEILVPDEKDVSEMIEAVKALINLKGQEISSLKKMLCISAHSFNQFKTFELIDLALVKAKAEYEELENIKTSLKSIII